ncbi:MAG TPA: RNA polymerase factor sigma-54 [Chromatiales bacterium]|nr:RNA polymerase factor sigma-54 [Chromatiales bacterium]
MKQSLQLRLGQQLTMTPQLQQAIRLLQLSTLDLQAEIQEALESNPMLELTDDATDDGAAKLSSSDGDATETPSENPVDDLSTVDVGAAGDGDVVSQLSDAVPDELPVDSSWEDTYDSVMPQTSSSALPDNSDYESQDESSESLQEHLLWQIRLTSFTEKDMEIAEAIIDAIDEQGYLTCSLEEIFSGLREELETEFDEVEAVLHRIHNLDPVGVGCRDLQECMLVQLQHLSPETPWLAEARRLITDHLKLLGSRDYPQIMRRMKCTQDELKEIMALVQTLNPRPGALVSPRQTEYVVPDVIVRKDNGAWKVTLNGEALPKVRVNNGYAGLVKRADNSADNTYLKNHLQEARWFIKSLQSRNETLLKVATCIVERQRGFLEHGEEAMKALVLHDVAEVVGMHESTISRVTTQKYMHTPRGIFELKYFFSSHVGTASGGECSATAIRALIKKLVAAENPEKPLSDSKISKILEEQGINVARRTIAKYRESISILSSSERKRLT